MVNMLKRKAEMFRQKIKAAKPIDHSPLVGGMALPGKNLKKRMVILDGSNVAFG